MLLAALLAGCGSPSDTGTSAPRDPGHPAASTVNDRIPPPRPVRVVEKPSASVEECIEKNIHDRDYDSLASRDARRKLRRLQVKADCEQQLAAR